MSIGGSGAQTPGPYPQRHPSPLRAQKRTRTHGPLRVRLRDPKLLGDLRYIFERSGFVVEARGTDAVAVLAPEAMDPTQAEEDAKLLLMLWRAMHPGVTAEPPGY